MSYIKNNLKEFPIINAVKDIRVNTSMRNTITKGKRSLNQMFIFYV